MSSVFDDEREELEPPTLEEFLGRLGSPVLSFNLGSNEVPIPLGRLTCCRIVHQPHCDDHIALTLIDSTFTTSYSDERPDEQRLAPTQTYNLDLLARPADFALAVQASSLQAAATAEACGGIVSGMHFDIWTLNLELAEIWRYLQRQQDEANQQVMAQWDRASSTFISSLPFILLDPDEPEVVARVQAQPTYRPIYAYADRVLVVPSEIGHDDEARYITSQVWGDEHVPPAVEAIRADPLIATEEIPA